MHCVNIVVNLSVSYLIAPNIRGQNIFVIFMDYTGVKKILSGNFFIAVLSRELGTTVS